MYENILVPVLVDNEHDTHASLQAAKTLASDRAKFTIVHVMEPIPSFVLAEIPADALNRTHTEIEDAMSRMAQSLEDCETKLISGHAGRAIVDYAHDNGVDCIVVASHSPRVSDFILGSTAAWVVRNANCSVHVVR
ncbi:universal stress protein [Sulfitobacter sp. SK012]|nr:universal stress protein [Sulfitobacter sp. SK012]